jgi:Zn-dependent protease
LPELTPEFIAEALTWYIVLLFSVSVHESAHGWTALQMGDDTAAHQGRITLNPLAHIDPVGTVLMPLMQIIFGGVPLLAWAKPTPVRAHNFRRLALGHILVAGAGPLSSGLLACFFTGLLFVAVRVGLTQENHPAVVQLLATGVMMNVGLAIFNLVPIPPLDGSWIASWGLPRSIAKYYDRVMEPYGFLILMLLVVTRGLSYVTGPPVQAMTMFLFRLVA